jgi:imidazolonepropionase-like amidohydrolase
VRYAIHCKRVLDVVGGEWLDDAAVVITDGVIEGVERALPDDTPIVDLGDRSLLPGLIDMHTHVLLQGSAGPGQYAAQILEEDAAHRVARAIRSMEIALSHGFTTLRDLGTEGAGFADVALREASGEGVVGAPRMFVAGPAVSASGSYPILGYRTDWSFPVGVAVCDGVGECRKEVRRQIGHGIDWLKVYVTVDRALRVTDSGYLDGPAVWSSEELQVLVQEAHAQGIRVAAHANSLTGTRMAVTSRVDSVEHGLAIPEDVASEMAEYGIAMVPTMLAAAEKYSTSEGSKSSGPSVLEMHERSIQNCLDAGVTLVFGTDAGSFDWLEHSQIEEFALMSRVGVSGAEAIRSATLEAAKLLGHAGRIGEIKSGALADLIACHGDPLVDISALMSVDFVMKEGQVLRSPTTGLLSECGGIPVQMMTGSKE